MSYQSKYTGQQIDNKLDLVNNKANQSDLNNLQNNITNLQNTKLNISDLLDKVYPVGSMYLAYNHTSPASLFGGTWTRIENAFLWGTTSTGYIGATGGSQTHTHTSAAHTHTIAGHTHTSAAHTHTTAGHTLTIAEMPKHTHTVSLRQYQSSGTSTGWVHDNVNQTYLDQTLTSSQTGGGGSHSHGNTGSTTPGNTGSTSLTTDSTTPGATGSSSNMPPYIQISMWRRTA